MKELLKLNTSITKNVELKKLHTRESAEAVQRLTDTLMSENQRLQAMVDQGGEVLNKQAHNNALWAKQNAQEAI